MAGQPATSIFLLALGKTYDVENGHVFLLKSQIVTAGRKMLMIVMDMKVR